MRKRERYVYGSTCLSADETARTKGAERDPSSPGNVSPACAAGCVCGVESQEGLRAGEVCGVGTRAAGKGPVCRRMDGRTDVDSAATRACFAL